MANTIIKGNNLMLFDQNGHSIAYATNHSLTLSGDTQDISSKDHGVWGATSVLKVNWEITSENLYTTEDFDSLFDTMIARQPIDVYFGLKAEADDGRTVVDGDYPYWTNAVGSYTGKAIITSLSANAPNGENATLSVTMTGVGSIRRTEAEEGGETPANPANPDPSNP